MDAVVEIEKKCALRYEYDLICFSENAVCNYGYVLYEWNVMYDVIDIFFRDF